MQNRPQRGHTERTAQATGVLAVCIAAKRAGSRLRRPWGSRRVRGLILCQTGQLAEFANLVRR